MIKKLLTIMVFLLAFVASMAQELPKLPPPPEPEVEEIFKVVVQVPNFPGCEEVENNERAECINRIMLEFIYEHLEYPSIAKKNGIEGTCVIRFHLDKNGHIKDPTILRDIGAQCGAEALRVVNLMIDSQEGNKRSKWTPGKARGNAVRVYFNLPIKFKLDRKN